MPSGQSHVDPSPAAFRDASVWKYRPSAAGGKRPPAQINAAAISYAVNGKQHIAINAGNALFAYALP